MRRLTPVLLFTLLCSPAPCFAQETTASAAIDRPRIVLDRATMARLFEGGRVGPTTDAPDVFLQQKSTADWASEGRACEGCPRRRAAAAYFQAVIINVIYNIGNQARGEETAKISFKSWWNNMKYGFEWDDNPFVTNQFGHPYQGSNYFTAGRANGLSYWESAALTAFGSASWEYFGENNYASFNDIVNTTLGGIALGEAFHRAAWMIRDTHATGKSRLWQEIFATVVDPMGGANRFISGDSHRVSDKPATFAPASSSAVASLGALWQGNNDNAFSESPSAFLEMDVVYGTPLEGRGRTPFEAFTVNLRMGGGQGLSDVRVRGRLFGQPLNDGKLHLALAHSFDYVANKAYKFGRQGFDMVLSKRIGAREGTSVVVFGGGGVTAQGAVDRVALTTAPATASTETDPDSEEERDYDYGPGTTFGGSAIFERKGRAFFDIAYQGYQIYVVDGVRSNHVLQRFRMDLIVPVHRRLAFGTAGEYFYRKTYFATGGERRDKFPQVRIYLAWR
jgi:hypothetical protein